MRGATVLEIAQQADLQALPPALAFSDRVEIQHRLGRMFVGAVARVDDGTIEPSESSCTVKAVGCRIAITSAKQLTTRPMSRSDSPFSSEEEFPITLMTFRRGAASPSQRKAGSGCSVRKRACRAPSLS